jgi:hypothetical protein
MLRSQTRLVEAFKRMQVIEDEEQVDAADEDGEPDEEVLNVHFSSCPRLYSTMFTKIEFKELWEHLTW